MSGLFDSVSRAALTASHSQRVLGAKYRLVRPLEVGGMGTVWIAEHLTLRSAVAVKLISREIAETDEGELRFLREARTAASLRSPHVVQILDHGVDEGTPYIVMELLDGESLAVRLQREQQLGPAQTERVVRHVARAIGRAHEAGIAHRDLKPSNIFIVANEEEELIKVLDFGIAKTNVEWTSAQASRTRTGTFLGTPGYVSPEQAEGARNVDYRTDIWSLGVIAFECLLGRPPFVGESFGSLLLAICSRPLPVPSEHGPLPRGFDEWFARACARDPERRFQSAREASHELRRLLGLSDGAASSFGLASGRLAPGAEPARFVRESLPGAAAAGVPSAVPFVLSGTASRSRGLGRAWRGNRWGILVGALGVATLALLLRSCFPPERHEPSRALSAPEPPAVAATPSPQTADNKPTTAPPEPSVPAFDQLVQASPARAPAATAAPPAERRVRSPRPAKGTLEAAAPPAPVSSSPPLQLDRPSINLGLEPPERAR